MRSLLLCLLQTTTALATLASSPLMSSSSSSSTTMIPAVTLKVALDESGGVDDALDGDSKRFTCSESLDAVHRLRRDCDAVMVGVGTVVRDDPTLTVRRVPLTSLTRAQPTRVVLDRSLRVSRLHPRPKLLEDEHATVILCAEGAVDEHELATFNSEIAPNKRAVVLPATDGDILDPSAVLAWLRDDGIKHVLLEGGPTTLKLFLEAACITRAIIVMAPIKFKQPVPGGISEKLLHSSGLRKVGSTMWGVDGVECWTREGEDWPGGGVGSWP